MNEKIGNIANYLAAALLLSMGLIYLFKNSFMPYHSDAVMLAWHELNDEIQTLILALIRAVAGGYIAEVIAVIVLQKKYAATKIRWLPLLI